MSQKKETKIFPMCGGYYFRLDTLEDLKQKIESLLNKIVVLTRFHQEIEIEDAIELIKYLRNLANRLEALIPDED